MIMAGISIVCKIDGFVKCRGDIDTLKAYIANQIQPLREAATVVTASVMRNFVAGGRPEKWEQLSPITKFIRAHRDGKQNLTPLPLRDTGRLAGSPVPHAALDAEGGTFGAKTNVSYARKMHEGGISEPSTVVINAFNRNTRAGNTSRVHSYLMHLKGGKRIPARPFMIPQAQDKPIIRQIFIDWIKKAGR